MRNLLRCVILVLLLVGNSYGSSYYLAVGNPGLTGVADLDGYTGAYAKVTSDDAQHYDFHGISTFYNGHLFDFYLTDIGVNLASALDLGLLGYDTVQLQLDKTPAHFSTFGAFNFGLQVAENNGASGSVPEILFDLGKPIGLIGNEAGYVAAAHVIIFEDRVFATAVSTGFAGDGTPAAVPEPGTLVLLAAGFFSFSIYTKRKMG